MKEKILKELKTKYLHLGFSAEVLEGVAAQLSTYVTEDDKAANAVAGAESMLKSFQSFADSRVASFRTENAKQKTDVENLTKQLAEMQAKLKGEDGGKGTGDIPEYVKALQESIKQVSENITALKSEKLSETYKSQFVSEMDKLKIPASFYNSVIMGRELNSAEQKEELVSSVKTGYQAHEQYLAETRFKGTLPPENGGDPKTEEETIAETLKEINTESQN